MLNVIIDIYSFHIFLCFCFKVVNKIKYVYFLRVLRVILMFLIEYQWPRIVLISGKLFRF